MNQQICAYTFVLSWRRHLRDTGARAPWTSKTISFQFTWELHPHPIIYVLFRVILYAINVYVVLHQILATSLLSKATLRHIGGPQSRRNIIVNVQRYGGSIQLKFYLCHHLIILCCRCFVVLFVLLYYVGLLDLVWNYWQDIGYLERLTTASEVQTRFCLCYTCTITSVSQIRPAVNRRKQRNEEMYVHKF